MKRIALSLLLAGTLLSNQLTAKAPLLLFRETSHFRVYCVENDQASAQKILARAEQDFAQLSRLFSHTYSTKINLNVFPSIPALHAHLGYPMAPSGQSMGPEWLINNTDTQNHTFSTVALTNPGTYHTAETILRFIITGMTDFFIKDAYKKPIPGWLIVGVGLWLTNSVMYQQQLATMAKNHALIPTFKQLTTDNPAEFGKRNGFACTLLRR